MMGRHSVTSQFGLPSTIPVTLFVLGLALVLSCFVGEIGIIGVHIPSPPRRLRKGVILSGVLCWLLGLGLYFPIVPPARLLSLTSADYYADASNADSSWVHYNPERNAGQRLWIGLGVHANASVEVERLTLGDSVFEEFFVGFETQRLVSRLAMKKGNKYWLGVVIDTTALKGWRARLRTGPRIWLKTRAGVVLGEIQLARLELAK